MDWVMAFEVAKSGSFRPRHEAMCRCMVSGL